MFENPITFALLASSVVSLAFYLFNREKDKKNRDSNPNMKYVLVFGIVFILGLIGRILFNGSSYSVDYVGDLYFNFDIDFDVDSHWFHDIVRIVSDCSPDQKRKQQNETERNETKQNEIK